MSYTRLISGSRPAGLLLVLCCLFAGCGYQFGVKDGRGDTGFRSLAIPLIESTSSTLGFEADFSRIFRGEFISHANIPLVPVEKAQVILSGTIYKIEADPLGYDSREVLVGGHTTTYTLTDSRRLIIRLDMRLTERDTGKIIWRDKEMVEKARYKVSNDPLETRYHQKKALETIASLLAKRAYLKTMERF